VNAEGDLTLTTAFRILTVEGVHSTDSMRDRLERGEMLDDEPA
jgi:hypothetical protein